MKKPPSRPDVPPRTSDNDKRRLHPDPVAVATEMLAGPIRYRGISKHKLEPKRFALEHYAGKRGDETLCDHHAGFEPSDLAGVIPMMRRGLRAGLIGHLLQQGRPKILWSVARSGWIFEARLTNAAQAEYHGYPVRPTEAIAEPVFLRFEAWVRSRGEGSDGDAARSCRNLYGFT